MKYGKTLKYGIIPRPLSPSPFENRYYPELMVGEVRKPRLLCRRLPNGFAYDMAGSALVLFSLDGSTAIVLVSSG
jgi:hypothetical protein